MSYKSSLNNTIRTPRPLLLAAASALILALHPPAAQATPSTVGNDGVKPVNAISPDDNKPEITRSNGKVHIDWSKLLPKVADIEAKQAGHQIPLQVAVLVNGDEKLVKPYPGDTSVEIPDSQGNQRDYYLEIRDPGGKAVHRTDMFMHESKNAQTVPDSAYAGYLARHGTTVDVPESLKKEGLDPKLTKNAVRLGYEKTVWVMAPDADPNIRKTIGEREDITVIPKLDANGKPTGADIVNKNTGTVLVKNVPAKNFFFKVDAAFNGNCFFWDDMFVSMATIPHDPELARQTVEFWLAVQKMNNGAIPREVRKSNLKSLWFPENIRAGQATTPNLHYTNPYLIHRVAIELYKYNPSPENLDLLRRVTKSMEDYAAWMDKNRAVRDRNGKFVGYVTDSLGSGGDNSRGERGNFSEPSAFQAGWADLLAQQIDLHKHLVQNYNLFARKDRETGKAKAAAGDLQRADEELKKAASLDQLMNSEYWDPQRKFYFDIVPDGHGGEKRDTQYTTAFGFWPLVSKSADASQVESLSATYLTPEKFGGAFPIPANARDTIPYADKAEDGYWSKWAHWPSVASITMDGFAASGRPDVAYEIATNFVKGMAHTSDKTVYEFYGETREKNAHGSEDIQARVGQHRGHETRADFAGWGEVPPVYDMLHHVIGLDPQIDGTMRWNMMLPLKDGETVKVDNLIYQGQEVKDLTLKRVSPTVYQVSALSDKPIKVELSRFRQGANANQGLSPTPTATSNVETVGGSSKHETTTTFTVRPTAG